MKNEAPASEGGAQKKGLGMPQTEDVSIGDQEIEMAANKKYLAVQVDSQLNRGKHIDAIKNTANRALGLIKRSKKYLSSNLLSEVKRGILSPI